MGGCLRFLYEALNWIALNQTMWSQTKACITKCRQKTVQSMTEAN
jgi:hypothetical protein